MKKSEDARETWIRETENDIQKIVASRIPEQTIIDQMALFRKGVPFVTLNRPAIPGDGILRIPENTYDHLTRLFLDAAGAGRVMKFVPASGAATRMFKPLQSLLNSGKTIDDASLGAGIASGDPDCEFADVFVRSLNRFAFYADLRAALSNQGLDIEDLRANGHYRDIIATALTPAGLDYANLPKGLIKFHKYPHHPRTPIEEHVCESISYCLDRKKQAAIHFTVSADHRWAIEQHLAEIRPFYETEGVRLNVGISVQTSATDTVAVDRDDRAFRGEADELVFRPGGHGALIQNLKALQGDIVFLKNIDNVVPDRLKPESYRFKRILAGYLVNLQQRTFAYLEKISKGRVSAPLLSEMIAFAQSKLCIVFPESFADSEKSAKLKALSAVFNRPIRVCGMVRNQGEPGGGPFWVSHATRPDSLQIVETAQIDANAPGQMAILQRATHFNPVDIVCGVRDFRGRAFDLNAFVDHAAAFISLKSQKGRELKALELPGLWNGGMAFWNTVFVDVPLVTFNPVKTVNDLLRDEHQATLPGHAGNAGKQEGFEDAPQD